MGKEGPDHCVNRPVGLSQRLGLSNVGLPPSQANVDISLCEITTGSAGRAYIQRCMTPLAVENVSPVKKPGEVKNIEILINRK